jgi:hypothetical protein
MLPGGQQCHHGDADAGADVRGLLAVVGLRDLAQRLQADTGVGDREVQALPESACLQARRGVERVGGDECTERGRGGDLGVGGAAERAVVVLRPADGQQAELGKPVDATGHRGEQIDQVAQRLGRPGGREVADEQRHGHCEERGHDQRDGTDSRWWTCSGPGGDAGVICVRARRSAAVVSRATSKAKLLSPRPSTRFDSFRRFAAPPGSGRCRRRRQAGLRQGECFGVVDDRLDLTARAICALKRSLGLFSQLGTLARTSRPVSRILFPGASRRSVRRPSISACRRRQARAVYPQARTGRPRTPAQPPGSRRAAS